MTRTLIFAAMALAAASVAAVSARAEIHPGRAVPGEAKAVDSLLDLRDPAYPPQATMALRLLPWAPPPHPKSGPAPDDGFKRLRIGSRRDVASELETASGAPGLQWVAAPGGGRTARLVLTSPGALALRLGLTAAALPEGVQLRFAGGAAGRAVAMAGAREVALAMREQGIFWSPVTEGDAQLVEVWIPEAAEADAVRLAADSASHIGAAPSRGFKTGRNAGAAGACERDAVCMTASNEALQRTARSVAKMVYTDNGATFLCSGTLVNGGDSGVPYFLTAAHCMQSQAAAATLNTFWFFEAGACGGSDEAAYRQLSGGATLLHSNAQSDVALLRLGDPAPAGAWFSGWDDAPLAAGTPVAAIHHPAGDVKKISLGQFVEASPTGNFALSAWSVGSTEGGSSGSGLFTPFAGEYLLRGGLRGGNASCENSGDVSNPANRDFYSRLDREAPTLRAWLAKSAPEVVANPTGLWWNPDENGWGLSIVQESASHAFATLFSYDAQGNPTWLVMPDAQWRSATLLEAAVYRTTGSALDRAYDPARFSATAVGSLRVEFRGPQEAVVTLTVDGRTTVKTIRKFTL